MVEEELGLSLKNKILNIPFSLSFVDELAKRLLAETKDDPLSLADVLIMLPNRRAVSSLKEAFVRHNGLVPTMLPRMITIGDTDEEEIFLSGIRSVDELKRIPPAIDRVERILIFTKIITSKPKEFGISDLSSAQACFLANELANLLDVVENEQLSFAKLQGLVPDEYSAHWQETLKFLAIITEFWPQILRERGVVDLSKRRNKLLELQIDLWKKNPPLNRVIIAGTTATYPLMKELVKTVIEFENSELVLAGLDRELEDEAWDLIGESHPQFELKDLLDYLQVSRFEVSDLNHHQFVKIDEAGRQKLISELMRPAVSTNKWREIDSSKIKQDAFNGINFVECNDLREEALSIALIMRQVLEVPEKTAALVTSDRNLARLVANELERWEVKVDDSAGKPLSLTPVGMFLRSIVKVCLDEFRPVSFLSLMKHPFTLAGFEKVEFRHKIRDYEKMVRAQKEDEELSAFVRTVKEKFADLNTLFSAENVNLKEMLEEHIRLAEELALADVLWQGEAGEAASSFVAGLYEYAEILDRINPRDYLGIFEALMASITVRPRYGTHPRLKILGPIEARLTNFDTVIIGEVNEGAWPKLASASPWMSRPMKKDFGFPLPEKAIGIMAHDFCSLLSGREVYLTRANRVQGTPMIKSRWLMRMETVFEALKIELNEAVAFKSWARYLDRSDVLKRILPPMPKPPVSARPRKLSASAVEYLMRDPYIIYAKHILRLRPLENLEPDLTMADYGNIIHGILDEFNKVYEFRFPDNVREELFRIGHEYFVKNSIGFETRAFWWPRFEKVVDWLVGQEAPYRQEVDRVHSEIEGSIKFDAPAGEFEITAKADRVDELKDGKVAIVDYKTGQIRSKKEVAGGYAPQLPIEGIIASQGGFDGVDAKDVEKLIYWGLGNKELIIDEEVGVILESNLQNIKELIAVFDFETTPYLARPNPKKVPKYSDYDHLARVKEWSVSEESDE